MKYVALMFGMWMVALVAQKYLHEQQTGACTVAPAPASIQRPAVVPNYSVSTVEQVPLVPVIYRF